MTDYIAIEHNSGYVWGCAAAETPEEACALIELIADSSRASSVWQRTTPIRSTDGGYHVYQVPTNFVVGDDGTDSVLIGLVEAHGRYIGDYRPRPEDRGTEEC